MQKVLREQQINIDYDGHEPEGNGNELLFECKEPSHSSSLQYCNNIVRELRSNPFCKGTVTVVMYRVCNMHLTYVAIGADRRDGSE